MAQIILDSNSNLIQGDFDSATVNNRTKLQTSTTNATTGVYVVPNGSATSASVQMANAADPTNASKIVVATNGSTDVQIVSGANGSGTYLPLSFYTNNDIRFQMGTAGQLGVRTGVGTVGYGTSGQVLTSGGASGAVSWAAASGQLLNIQYFTTAGTATYTPTSGTNSVIVEVIGGGGGGTGATDASASTAGTGGTSSFGALVSATGGTGGGSGTGGSGGSGSSGDINITGVTGIGITFSANTISLNTPYTPGFIGTIGAGGKGGASRSGITSTGGSGGSAGYARKKITSSFSGVTVTVGAAGTVGTSTFGTAGYAGAVIVYEYS